MIKPIANYILIEPIEVEKQNKGGFILSETAGKEPPKSGNVIAVGDECKYIKTGDKVLFTLYGPNAIEFEDKKYLIAKEEDILAIIK